MAAAYRSISSTTYASRTNTTITAPAGVLDDDVLVLVFVRGQSGGAPATPTWPAGFTLLSGYPTTVADSGGYTVRKWVLAKTASGEGSSYTVTHGNGASQGVMFAVSGGSGVVVATQNPQTFTGYAGGTVTATATGLTTVVDDSLIAFVVHNWDLYGSGSPPTGSTPTFTERLDDATSLLYVATGILATAGATGNKSQNTGNAFAHHPWSASLIDVRAAVGGSFTATGALAAGSAVVAGAAARLGLHTSAGALTAGAAGVSGAALHPHLSAGALAADSATVAGSAAHLGLHASSGALAAGGAAVAGSAALTAASGTFYWVIQPAAVADPTRAQIVAGQDGAGSAAVAFGSEADSGQTSPLDAAGAATGLTPGTAYEVAWVWYDGADESNVVVGAFTTLGAHAATGALSAAAAEVAGTAAHLTLHTSSGALAAGDATVAGTAARGAVHDADGELAAGAATVAGTAVHLTLHASTGALSAGAAAVAGTAAHEHAATGALAAAAATVAGSAAHLTLHASSGALAAGSAAIAGDAEHVADGQFDAAGSLSAQAAAVVGAAQRFALHTATGALAAGASVVAGTAAHNAAHTSTGALSAGASTVAGSAAHNTLHTSAGAIAAGPATVSGSAAHITLHDATGDLQAGAATVAGTGFRSEAGAADPASIWNYQLSNGLTAEQNIVQIYAWLDELHRVHGLQSAHPLVVEPTLRSAGALIQQVISTAGETVTVTRQ